MMTESRPIEGVDTLATSYNGEVWVEDTDPEGLVLVVELPKTE